MNPIKITDTTLRDGHQSLMATRLKTSDIELIASHMDQLGFHSIEAWGGATFDVCTRFLIEDPWDRLRKIKKLIPNTPLTMLLRGQNLVGYRNYANDVVSAFIKRSSESGIDIFRVFDALNDVENLRSSANAIKENGKHLQMTICYSTAMNEDGSERIYTTDYFINKAKEYQEIGADSICLKDMAGLLSPYVAYELVTSLKSVLDIPLQLHTHYTSGMASMTVLKAIEAGIDLIDTCLAPLSLRTSQPAIEPIVTTLNGTERDTGLNMHKLLELGDLIEELLPKYREHMDSSRISIIDAKVLEHQIPGGMVSNLISQLHQANAISKLNEVLSEIPHTRKDLGYPPLVTPISQIVASQSVSNVLFGRYKMINNQVENYIKGLYGNPPTPIDTTLIKKVVNSSSKPIEVNTKLNIRNIEPELTESKKTISDISSSIDDILTYTIFPNTGLEFLKIKHGKKPALKDTNQNSSSKGFVVSPTNKIPSASSKARKFNVSIDNNFYEVKVDPHEILSRQVINSSLSANNSHKNPREHLIIAPMPGIISEYFVKPGEKIETGDPVASLNVMNRKNTLPSPFSGTVKSIIFKTESTVSKDDVLLIIESTMPI